jgi:5-methylcytosine-specific restriction enzyme A
MAAHPRMYNTARWKRLRRSILERHQWRCYWCGRELDRELPRMAHVDHLRPVAEGGARFDPANLVVSCPGCNATRGQATKTKLQAAGARPVGGAGFVGYKPAARWGAIRR